MCLYEFMSKEVIRRHETSYTTFIFRFFTYLGQWVPKFWIFINLLIIWSQVLKPSPQSDQFTTLVTRDLGGRRSVVSVCVCYISSSRSTLINTQVQLIPQFLLSGVLIDPLVFISLRNFLHIQITNNFLYQEVSPWYTSSGTTLDVLSSSPGCV